MLIRLYRNKAGILYVKATGYSVMATFIVSPLWFDIALSQTFGFRGPVALAGYLYQDLVENRNWISEDDYKDGLALAQHAPGPLAAQLGIYLGAILIGALIALMTGISAAQVLHTVFSWVTRVEKKLQNHH